MGRVIGRQKNIQALNELLLGQRRAQFAFVYGRPRIGKTTLLRHWAQQSGLPYFYWKPPRGILDPETSLIQALKDWAHLENLLPLPGSPFTDPLSVAILRVVKERPVILIFDEFHRADEVDPSLASRLQHLWDHELQHSAVILVIVGSHFGTLLQLQNYEAPLYGRCTATYWVDPLPYAALADFYPGYTVPERVATYAALGGVPAYLEQFDPNQSLNTNIRRVLLTPRELLENELGSITCGLEKYVSDSGKMLRAIATGLRSVPQIARSMGIAKLDLLDDLYWLQKWQLVEHRLSAVTPLDHELRMTRRGLGRYR